MSNKTKNRKLKYAYIRNYTLNAELAQKARDWSWKKIERELGWVPEETFETGLRKTVKWYLDNRQWWESVLSGAYRLERLGE